MRTHRTSSLNSFAMYRTAVLATVSTPCATSLGLSYLPAVWPGSWQRALEAQGLWRVWRPKAKGSLESRREDSRWKWAAGRASSGEKGTDGQELGADCSGDFSGFKGSGSLGHEDGTSGAEHSQRAPENSTQVQGPTPGGGGQMTGTPT